MKIFKLMTVALVAMFGFIACDKHECNDHNHSADLVGIWTCLTADYAEALVIKADGSALSTGVEDGEYWENVAGNIVVKDGKVTMTFEDGDNFEGYLDVVPGIAFTIHDKEGEYYTFNYCKEDLADEVVGMWVCNDGPKDNGTDMAIETFNEDGSVTFTGYSPELDGMILHSTSKYKVIGDILFHSMSNDSFIEGPSSYVAVKLTYSPKATAMGDIMLMQASENSVVTLLRVKQSLNLVGKKYDYDDIYVTNVKGLDKDIDFIEGVKFNFAKMDGSMMDEILKSILFAVEFPDAQTFKYSCRYPEQNTFMEADMVVDGNKMTVKISPRNAAFRDIEMYVFQDADDSQMHMYMSTTAFINFFGNMQATMMAQMGQLDLTDAAAVNAIYDNIDDAVDTINVSFTFKAAK